MSTFKPALLACSWPAAAHVLRRYQGLITILALLAAALGATYGALRPRAYAGDALVQVVPQQVPDRLVPAPVSGEWQDRLAALSQQLVTAAQLQPLVQQFRLAPGERVPMTDAVLAQVRRRIEIYLDRSWMHERPGAFHVTFEHPDPRQAAVVANHLARLLIDLNLRHRRSSANGASDFLDKQLAQARLDLELQDARLTRYRLAHVGEIPGQESVLVAALNRLQLQWQSAQDGLARVEQSRAVLADALNAAQTPPNSPVSATDAPSDRLRSQIEALRSRYNDRHPDVRILQAQALALPPPPPSASNAAPIQQHLQALGAQVRSTTTEQARLTAQSVSLLLQIATYQTRLEQSPLHEVQWNSLNSDHEIARLNYLALLQKHSAAQMSAALDSHQQDETFRLLEPAAAPSQPKGLDWPAFAVVGMLAGLLAGIAAAFTCDLVRNVIQGPWELPAGVPLLGCVPSLGTPARQRVQDWRHAVAASASLLLLLFWAVR